MSREAQEKGATYGPGGWRSKRRQASRADVVLAVQMAARGGRSSEGPAPGGAGHLLAAYVRPLRGSFKISPGKDGRWWYKVSWETPTGRVYLASSYDELVDPFAGLVDLCEQIEECKRGLRKPSPDVYRGQ